MKKIVRWRKEKQDKKAWLRIVEAFIAIMIILGTVLVLMQKQNVKEIAQMTEARSTSVYDKQMQILDIVSKNQNLRDEIVVNINPYSVEGGSEKSSGKSLLINNFIYVLVPDNWNFEIRICKIDEVCPNPQKVYDREVYVAEKIVSSTLEKYDLRKLSFFVWFGSDKFGYKPLEQPVVDVEGEGGKEEELEKECEISENCMNLYENKPVCDSGKCIVKSCPNGARDCKNFYGFVCDGIQRICIKK